jgi:hypothetical protein
MAAAYRRRNVDGETTVGTMGLYGRLNSRLVLSSFIFSFFVCMFFLFFCFVFLFSFFLFSFFGDLTLVI